MTTELVEYEREGASLAIIQSGSIAAMTRGEIDSQIATAKQFPRSLAKVKDEARSLACMDAVTAFSCWYTVPRGGKNIEGPSIRLAEIMASAWGNLRYGARVIDEDDHFITVQGFAHDLEKNQAVTFEIRRRITYKDGRKFNDDMIAVTTNAASAIALRNCIFRVVPRALVNSVMADARRCAEGSIKNLEEARKAVVKYFGDKKISAERVCAVINRKSIDDITLNDVLILRNLAESIQHGDISLDEAFPRENVKMPAATNELPEAQPTPEQEPAKRGRKKKEPAAAEPAVETDEHGIPLPPANGALFGNPATDAARL